MSLGCQQIVFSVIIFTGISRVENQPHRKDSFFSLSFPKAHSICLSRQARNVKGRAGSVARVMSGANGPQRAPEGSTPRVSVPSCQQGGLGKETAGARRAEKHSQPHARKQVHAIALTPLSSQAKRDT